MTHQRSGCHPVGSAAGYDIHGSVKMTIDPAGTVVSANVSGLGPEKVYGSHLHNGTCASGGGGHYQNVAGGGVTPAERVVAEHERDRIGTEPWWGRPWCGLSDVDRPCLERFDERPIGRGARAGQRRQDRVRRPAMSRVTWVAMARVCLGAIGLFTLPADRVGLVGSLVLIPVGSPVRSVT
jgi:hypothetical protein